MRSEVTTPHSYCNFKNSGLVAEWLGSTMHYKCVSVQDFSLMISPSTMTSLVVVASTWEYVSYQEKEERSEYKL